MPRGTIGQFEFRIKNNGFFSPAGIGCNFVFFNLMAYYMDLHASNQQFEVCESRGLFFDVCFDPVMFVRMTDTD